MILRPKHANPTPPPISTLHQISTSLSLSASSPLPTALRGPTRPKLVDISAWARQLQTRRHWTYALIFNYIAEFEVIVLNNFQDQLVLNNKFRVGGLILEGSVVQPSSSLKMEFVVIDFRS
ncbi:hypothetical protein C1H46_043069 [Malus baccata]|uniref:Uncharacterized protein n=1 Tax=Malus baccata TaxID=106549 RepID=A0A540KBU1_MALBA|nr:hypothetical protein C1H46_043069 [Malus baccata]